MTAKDRPCMGPTRMEKPHQFRTADAEMVGRKHDGIKAVHGVCKY
jgi:hypothetical protein